MSVWTTNTAQGEVGSAAWVLVFVFVVFVRFAYCAMTGRRSREVSMMASVESFVASVLETTWAVGAGVLAAKG
jgi:hypothetical protein